MSLQQYSASAMDAAKEAIKIWIKSKLKIVAIVIAVAAGVLLPFFVIFGNAEEGDSSLDLQSASSSSWEQFLRYVATKEGGTRTADGLNYIVENDGAGYPTVGHGLCLKSSDGYLNVEAFSAYGIDSTDLADRWLAGERDLTVSVEICDAIWEEGVRTRYQHIVSEYPNLTTYQHYALTDVKYRRGNTNGFQEAYESKWTSSDDRYGEYVESEESFSTDTLFSFFWNGGHPLEGVNIRKKDQWVLFKYGYYRPLGEYFRINTLNPTGSIVGNADTSTLSPNDYGGTYVSSSNGYTFIQYYQNGSSWSGDALRGASSTTIGASGCNVTSNAIALSALTGDTITPRQVNNNFNFINSDAAAILNTSAFSQYASQIRISGYLGKSANALIANLRQGKVVILKFATAGYGRRGCKWLGTNYSLCSVCRL